MTLRRAGMLVAAAAFASACGRGSRAEVDPAAAAVATMSLQQQAAQTVAARMPPGGGRIPPALEAELATGAAGAVLIPGPLADGTAAMVAAARSVAPWSLLAIVDLQAAGPLPQPQWLAATGEGPVLQATGAAAGEAVHAVGGDVLRFEMPTLNGEDPLGSLRADRERIGGGVAQFTAAATSTGAVAVVALGGEAGGAPLLRWDRARLEGRELEALRAVLAGRDRPEMIELTATRLPALTGDTLPLALSPAAVEGLLRRDLGFSGVIAADPSPIVASGFAGDEEAAAVALLSAGVDLLMGVERPAAAVDAIVAAVREERLDPGRLAEAATRVMRLRLALRPAEAPPPHSAQAAGADQRASSGEAGSPVPVDSGGTAGARPGSGTSSGNSAGRVGTAVRELLAHPAVRMAAAAEAAAHAGSAWGSAADSAVAGKVGEEEGEDELALADRWWPAAPTLRRLPADSLGMDPGLEATFDEIVMQAMEDSVFTAAAIAVGRSGGLALMRGWGREGRGGLGGPVDGAGTLFDLASLTKVVGTTTAAALLVEEDRLGLDAPVADHLPRFRGEGREGITVRHLLSHTSGLPAGRWLFGSARSPDEALRQVLEQDPVRPPGERVEYSDLGMILLAAVVEAAAEQPIDHLLAQRVFAPLGMMSTMYLPPLVLRERAVPTAEITERDFPLAGVVHDANAFRLGGIAGHAGLFSTARDLAVFAQTMLNGGRHGTVRILSPATVDTFTRRQTGAEQRALGWDTPSRVSSAGDFFSARSFGHTGYTGTSLWIDPENDLFVVLLTNRTYTEATARETLRFRAEVHNAAARALTDRSVRRRPAR